jgi:hypothetical protein
MYFRKTILSLLVTLTSLITSADNYTMRIALIDGDNIDVFVDQSLAINVESDKLHVTSSDLGCSIAIEHVANITYLAHKSEVDEMIVSEPTIKVENSTLTVICPTSSSNSIRIYKVNGTLMQTMTFDTTANISLANYSPGIYIVQVNNKQYLKFAIK